VSSESRWQKNALHMAVRVAWRVVAAPAGLARGRTRLPSLPFCLSHAPPLDARPVRHPTLRLTLVPTLAGNRDTTQLDPRGETDARDIAVSDELALDPGQPGAGVGPGFCWCFSGKRPSLDHRTGTIENVRKRPPDPSGRRQAMGFDSWFLDCGAPASHRPPNNGGFAETCPDIFLCVRYALTSCAVPAWPGQYRHVLKGAPGLRARCLRVLWIRPVDVSSTGKSSSSWQRRASLRPRTIRAWLLRRSYVSGRAVCGEQR
jgi:hypothetical protein